MSHSRTQKGRIKLLITKIRDFLLGRLPNLTEQYQLSNNSQSDAENKTDITGSIKSITQEIKAIRRQAEVSESEKRSIDKRTMYGIWAAAIVAVLAIAEAHCSSENQVDEIEKQLNVMKADQRPWIAIKTYVLAFLPHPADGISIDHSSIRGVVTFTNGGKSPAFIQKVEFQFGVWENFPADADSTFTPNGEEDSQLFLVPGQEMPTGVNQIVTRPQNSIGPIAILPEEWEDFLNGRKHLYFYGNIIYGDLSEQRNTHYTHACWKFSSNSAVRATLDLSKANITICNKYNDAK